MSTSAATLQVALRHHQAGELAQAERLYTQVLEREPDHAYAHHFMGLVALAQHQPARAIDHLARAAQLNPAPAEFHRHLGTALSQAGRVAEAIASFEESLRRQPDSPAVCNDLGRLLFATGRMGEAEACFRKLVELNPQKAEGHSNLGSALQHQQKWYQALASFREAVRLRPKAAGLYYNLGNCYEAQACLADAEAAYRQALALEPKMAVAHQQLGFVLHSQQRYAEAVECQQAALRLAPEMAEAHASLAATFQLQNKLTEAEASFRRALALQPENANTWLGLGAALQAQHRTGEALASYEEAVRRMPDNLTARFNLAQCLDRQGDFKQAIAVHQQTVAMAPDDPDMHFYLGCAWLAHGDFRRGWPEFEWRQKKHDASRRRPEPVWQGEELRGERILIHAEFALGDTLQFIRYVPLVERLGGDVFLEVQRPLIPLLEQSGFRQLVAAGTDVSPRCAWRVPLLSLPRIFDTTLETIPTEVPYLAASPQRIEQWAGRLQKWPGVKVGIHWQGSKSWTFDNRSIPLAAFEPLARVPGVTLFSLQKSEGTAELAAVGDRFEVIDFGDELDASGGAFLDTAAIMKQLDLVITCDSSPAHLAGGLGVPVWVALPYQAEWRWLRTEDGSPWYPTMRLFREQAAGGWSAVLDRMSETLRSWPSSGTHSRGNATEP